MGKILLQVKEAKKRGRQKGMYYEMTFEDKTKLDKAFEELKVSMQIIERGLNTFKTGVKSQRAILRKDIDQLIQHAKHLYKEARNAEKNLEKKFKTTL